jgi:hypothetical protein
VEDGTREIVDMNSDIMAAVESTRKTNYKEVFLQKETRASGATSRST